MGTRNMGYRPFSRKHGTRFRRKGYSKNFKGRGVARRTKRSFPIKIGFRL